MLDCGLASTPAMFMTTVDLGCDGAVQLTASHHPYHRNGLKFFLPSGGLDLVRNSEVKAAYYLPYEDYRSLFDLSGIGTETLLTDSQELTALPSDAVLLWQAGQND